MFRCSDIERSTFEYEGSVFVLPCNRNANTGLIESDQKQDIELSLEMILKDSSIKEALGKIEEINSDSLKISQKARKRSQNFLITSP